MIVEKACILGLGQFGFALAKILAEKNPNIKVVGYDPAKEYVDSLNNNRSHPIFHKGITLPDNVTGTHDNSEAVKDAQLIVLAVPGQFIRGCIQDILPHIRNDIIILNVAKALESNTNKYLSQVVEEEMKTFQYNFYFAALSGGMIAEEVTKKFPIAADIACHSIEIGELLKSLFSSNHFKLQVTDDVIGVEIASALKNVVAIGAGIFDGLGYEASSKSAYISEMAREMKQLAIVLGAKEKTFEIGGHAWTGDLLTTCFGQSRNRYFGEMIGKGIPVKEALDILEKERKRSEGYLSTKSFYLVAKEHNINANILKQLYDILFEGKDVKECIYNMFK